MHPEYLCEKIWWKESLSGKNVKTGQFLEQNIYFPATCPDVSELFKVDSSFCKVAVVPSDCGPD